MPYTFPVNPYETFIFDRKVLMFDGTALPHKGLQLLEFIPVLDGTDDNPTEVTKVSSLNYENMVFPWFVHVFFWVFHGFPDSTVSSFWSLRKSGTRLERLN